MQKPSHSVHQSAVNVKPEQNQNIPGTQIGGSGAASGLEVPTGSSPIPEARNPKPETAFTKMGTFRTCFGTRNRGVGPFRSKIRTKPVQKTRISFFPRGCTRHLQLLPPKCTVFPGLNRNLDLNRSALRLCVSAVQSVHPKPDISGRKQGGCPVSAEPNGTGRIQTISPIVRNSTDPRPSNTRLTLRSTSPNNMNSPSKNIDGPTPEV